MAHTNQNPKNQPSTDTQLLDLVSNRLFHITDEVAEASTYARMLTMMEVTCKEDNNAMDVLASDVMARIEDIYAKLQEVRYELKTPEQKRIHNEHEAAA